MALVAQVLLEKADQHHKGMLKDPVVPLEQEANHQLEVYKQNPNSQLNNRRKLKRQIKRL